SKTVESILTKGRGRVVADTASNALIITDTRSRLTGVTEFVRGLDVRTPQLSIQAKIIFVDRTDLEALGLRYDLGDSHQFFNKLVQRTDPATGEPFDKNVNVVDLGGNSVSAIGNADATIKNSALDLIYSTTIGGFALTTFLSALETSELADIQAEPVISTLDNRQADILVGEETPVRVIDASAASGNDAPRANVQMKETGIRLTVTPHVTNNRQILMQLHTERSALQILAETDLGFNFAKQKADNQLLVNDGETAVIGGLTVTEVNKTRTGIPLLSGLPIVGKLFSSTTESERRRDLIILVTPPFRVSPFDLRAFPFALRLPRGPMHLRFTTAGESHGKGYVAVVEGLPAGLPVSAEWVDRDLARRMMGYGRGARMKIERDRIEWLAGVRAGETLGSPVAMLIHNRDWANWEDVMAHEGAEPGELRRRRVARPRPGHADLAGVLKYDRLDARDILERASARETAARVAAGALARRLLDEFGVEI
ncbi:MAG: chorismate synthase, partial [Gemmatimonadetes bacterium]|nr:chorismate synthase [Gemmatimonadota bacterium]